MKKIAIAAAAAAVVMVTSGCCVMPNAAILAPLDMGSTSGEYYDASVKPTKIGKATVQGILFFTQGDASVRAAMANGGITKINRIERETQNILCIVAKYTTVVYGE